MMLLKLREHEHVVLGNMHHIISDGWSMGILADELAAAVRAGDGDGLLRIFQRAKAARDRFKDGT